MPIGHISTLDRGYTSL